MKILHKTAILVCIFFAVHLEAQGLKIIRLTGDFYIYTTYNEYKGELVPSNSMYVVTKTGVLLFDTPWGEAQCQPLLDSIWKRHHKEVKMCFVTHYHADRTGGLDFLAKKGVKTFSSKLTDDLAAKHHEKQAQKYFEYDTTIHYGDLDFELFYPGEGHTKDNIVVWFPEQKILYGGCLIKSTEIDDLGNIADANLKAWPKTIKKLMKKFPKPKFVIPGHFSWSNNKSLQHTLDLLNEHKAGNR